MGPRRCHCRTNYPPQHVTISHPLPVRLQLLLLLYSFALVSVSGFSLQSQKGGECHIQHCVNQYEESKTTLEVTGGFGGDTSPEGASHLKGVNKHDRQCMLFRTWFFCIKAAKNKAPGCQGSIQYYSMRNGLLNQMKRFNCSEHGPTPPPPRPPPSRPVPYHCRYHGEKTFQHCGLFGDPHLRTFTNQFQTCKVKGAWPLVNNDYLTVQVTNDPVLGGAGEATATSKLTVLVKSYGYGECGVDQYHTYQAQTDSLPGAFEDGNTSYGPHGSVQLREVEANRHVEIHVHYIATTIIVRQIGRYFTFVIHMPEELVNSSTSRGEPELCSKGCPASEQINYMQYLAQKRDSITRIQSEATDTQLTMTRQEAEVVCRKSGLVDFYFDSCVFDLMATGDKNFTLAALSALEDVLRLDPAMAAKMTNRSTVQIYDVMFGAASALSRTVSLWWYVVCVMSVLLTLRQQGAVQVR